MDCSPGSASALTRVCRNSPDSPNPDFYKGQQYPCSYTDGAQSFTSISRPRSQEGWVSTSPQANLCGWDGGVLDHPTGKSSPQPLSTQAGDKICNLPAQPSLLSKSDNSAGVTGTIVSPGPSSWRQ